MLTRKSCELCCVIPELRTPLTYLRAPTTEVWAYPFSSWKLLDLLGEGLTMLRASSIQWTLGQMTLIGLYFNYRKFGANWMNPLCQSKIFGQTPISLWWFDDDTLYDRLFIWVDWLFWLCCYGKFEEHERAEWMFWIIYLAMVRPPQLILQFSLIIR